MTHRRFEGDPIEALRRADPLDPLEVPHDTTGAHARSLFQEVTAMDSTTREEPTPARRPLMRRLALGLGTAVVMAAIGGVSWAVLRDAPENIVGGEPVGGGGAASMCLVYSDDTLLAQELAFDGTLVSAEGNGTQAVFEVHRWFKGGEGDRITLNAEGLLVGGPSIALVGTELEVGQRYLASSTDGYVSVCGLTVTYDTALAEHWAELFGA